MSRCFRCHLALRYYRLCRVCPPCRPVRTCMCPGHTWTRMPLSCPINTSFSPLSGPLLSGVGAKPNPAVFISHPFLQLPIMTPTISLFFLSRDWVILIPLLYLPHRSSFSVSKCNQECGKLEGDHVCPSQGDGDRDVPSSGPASWPCRWLDLQDSLEPTGGSVSGACANSQAPSFSIKKRFLPVTTERLSKLSHKRQIK